MSEKVKVSVILPSYNVGHYIDECLQSVINQSLLDIEIICVDADSVDGTKEIIGSYLSDSRIKLVTSQKKSYGYQVNLGMSLARGEYVSIVETDDFIAADMLEKLYSIAKKEDADIVKCGYYAFITGLDGKYLTNEVSLDRDGIKSGGPFSFIDYCNKSQGTDPFVGVEYAGLPSGYTELYSISSTADGSQYIDMNIRLYESTPNFDFKIKLKLIGNGSDNQS